MRPPAPTTSTLNLIFKPQFIGLLQNIAFKKKGLNIYLLSNAGRSADIYWPAVPASVYFDGKVISAFVNCVKPDRKIYEILLDRYGLKADECLFIDDAPANVEGAKEAGIDAYLFDEDVNALSRYIFGKLEKC